MNDEHIILIERLRKGDMPAFEELFRLYYEKLCLFAYRFTDDLYAAEEIVADTYTSLWEKRATIIISLSFRSYIYRAVQNRCLNYIKHKNIERAYIDYILQSQYPLQHNHDLLREHELQKEIEDAIENLPEKSREIFKLSRFHQLKYAQIAGHLNISIKTVERQMAVALEQLRRQLKHLTASA